MLSFMPILTLPAEYHSRHRDSDQLSNKNSSVAEPVWTMISFLFSADRTDTSCTSVAYHLTATNVDHLSSPFWCSVSTSAGVTGPTYIFKCTYSQSLSSCFSLCFLSATTKKNQNALEYSTYNDFSRMDSGEISHFEASMEEYFLQWFNFCLQTLFHRPPLTDQCPCRSKSKFQGCEIRCEDTSSGNNFGMFSNAGKLRQCNTLLCLLYCNSVFNLHRA